MRSWSAQACRRSLVAAERISLADRSAPEQRPPGQCLAPTAVRRDELPVCRESAVAYDHAETCGQVAVVPWGLWAYGWRVTTGTRLVSRWPGRSAARRPLATAILRRWTAMLPEGPLIGREHELLALELALRADRLVTLTGAGGCGKTRVARELASRIGGAPDSVGTVVIELASTPRSDDVADAVVRALGVRERAGRTQVEVILDRLAEETAVLVIDNCEHVRAGVAQLIARLMDDAPGIRVFPRPREPLGLPGEQVLALPALGLPEDGGDVAAVVRSDAGRLF